MNIQDLKTQAKRLRAHLATKNIDLNHSASLAALAAQHGYRDWNTLCAKADGSSWPAAGERVKGTYLGHEFTGFVKSVHITKNASIRRYHFHFDNAIDVVTSEHFSNFRKHVSADLNTALQSVNVKGEQDNLLVLA